MTQYLKDFKSGFNGGTRANRFEVIGSFPNGVSPQPITKFHIFSSSIPAGTLGSIVIPWRGRNVFEAGDREFQPWVVGVYDDTGTKNIWRAMHSWSVLLNKHENNRVAYGQNAYFSDELSNGGNALLKTWTVRQLNDCNEVLKIIDLYRCFPAVVSEIPLDMGNGNAVQFPVTLSFDYCKIRNL